MKKSLIPLTVLAILAMVGCSNKQTSSSSQEDTSSGIYKDSQGLTYVLQNDGTYCVSGGPTKSLTSISISKTINGRKVTRIAEKCFYNHSMHEISIPDSITTIDSQAFCYCLNLQSITLPDGLKYIDSYAFYRCGRLQSITLPNSLEYIGKNAFSECDLIFNKHNGICYLGNDDNQYLFLDHAFEQLESIEIHDFTKIINFDAFSNCDFIKNITIPDGIKFIGDNDFKGVFGGITYYNDCTYLGNENNPYLYLYQADYSKQSISVNNSTKIIASCAFSNIKSDYHDMFDNKINSIRLPDNLIQIGSSAFEECKNLTNINCPDSVRYIGARSFANCSSLNSIRLPDNLVQMGSDAFEGCSSLKEYEGCKYVGTKDNPYLYLVGANANIQTYTSNKNTKFIYGEVFSNCTKLTSANITNNVEFIDSFAFSNCTSLTSVTLPNNICSIPTDLFKGCKNLYSIIIPKSVGRISEYAFEGCSFLHEISIPINTFYIGSSAFKECNAINDIYYEGTLEQWGNIEKNGNDCLNNAKIHFGEY